MSPRTTGWLLLATVALAAFVWLYEIRGEPEREAAALREARLFPDLDASAIDAVSFERPDVPAVRVQRDGGGWRLVAPLAAPADAPSLDAMTRRLAGMKSQGKIEDPAAPSVYGLDEKALVVSFETATGSRTLRIGRETPVGHDVYVALGPAGEGGVLYMVSSADAAAFDRSADALRDHRVLAFQPADVARVHISAQPPPGTSGGLQALLERGEDGDFAIREPAPLAADADAVRRLVSDLSLLRADSFVDDPAPALRRALEAPAYEVRLEDASGATLGRLALAPESAAPDEAARGFRIAQAWDGSVVRVREALVAHLPKRLFALRPKAVARFDPESVHDVELDFGSAEPLLLERNAASGAWTLAGEPARAEPVDALLEALSHLDAVDVAAEAMGPAELAGVGLAPARLHVLVRGAPGGAAESKAPGDVLAELRIGRSDPLRGTLVQTRERSEILRLPTAVDSALPQDRDAFLQQLHFVAASD